MPGYYHKVADKYLKSSLKPDGSAKSSSLASRASRRAGLTGRPNYQLPKIKSTGQGNGDCIIFLGIKVKPKVTTGFSESRNIQNSWKKKIRMTHKIRPLDVMNQIVSRTKRAQDKKTEFKGK